MDKEQIATWQLERFAQGELTAEAAAQVRGAVDRDPALQEALASLKRSNAELLSAHPSAQVVAEVRRRASVQSVRRRRPALVLATAFASLLAVALSARTSGDAPPAVMAEVTRAKGLSPRLLVYRQQGTAAEALPDGAALTPHEVLQLAYVAAGRAYGALVSIDGRGGVTLHLPAAPGMAAPLAPSGEVPLSRAFELDDAPHFERFFLVTHDAPFDAATVLEAARRQSQQARAGVIPSTLPLPAELEQTAFTVQKVSP